MTTMIPRQQVVDVVRTWLYTKWQHQAALKGVATDCIGLISGVARELGLPEAYAWSADPRYVGYGPRPIPELLLEAADKYMDRISTTSAGLGDVLLMKMEGEPRHFAFVSGMGQPMSIIHAYVTAGRVVENDVDATWRARIIRAYRLRGVE